MTTTPTAVGEKDDGVSVSQSGSAPLPPEQWLPAPGLTGRYEVSDQGRVRSLGRVVAWGAPRSDGSRRTRAMAGKVLTLQTNGEGYSTVTVATPSGQESRAVHRMICRAFNGEPPFAGALARHADDDKANNVPGNLSWGTVAQNAADAMRNGRVARGERIGISRVTEAQAREIKALYAPRSQDCGAKALAARFGVSRHIVSSIVTGKAWSWL